MLQLCEHAAAVCLDCLGDGREPGDEVVVVDSGHPWRRAAARSPDDGGALADESGARGRSRFEFRAEHVGGVGAGAGALQERRAVEPVPEPETAHVHGVVEARHTVADGRRALQRGGGNRGAPPSENSKHFKTSAERVEV